jgi:phosphoribosylformylglycinamidine synthase PurS subunit
VTRFEALVEVRLRPGIADPQGATIEKALPALGFDAISDVRAGKAFRVAVEASDEVEAEKQLDDLCRRFLTNPVIEDALITISTPSAPSAPSAPSTPSTPSTPTTP